MICDFDTGNDRLKSFKVTFANHWCHPWVLVPDTLISAISSETAEYFECRTTRKRNYVSLLLAVRLPAHPDNLYDFLINSLRYRLFRAYSDQVDVQLGIGFKS
jgi:hypothetical protein